MRTSSKWQLALFILCTPLLARAQIVQVSLSGTISSVSGGYTSPAVGVGSTYTWSFSYDSSTAIVDNPSLGTTGPTALQPFTSSTLTVGADTWTLNTQTASGETPSILAPTNGGMTVQLYDSNGPDIPTVPTYITGDFPAFSFSWNFPGPTLLSLPTAAQLTTLVAAALSGSSQLPVVLVFSARGQSGPDELTATDTSPTISINGVTVQAPSPAPFTLAPAALSFASQAIGTSSATQSVTLTNTSTGAISLGSISAGGGFSQSNNCVSPLAAGGQCLLMASFAPTQAGQSIGALTVPYGSASYLVALSGVAPVDVTLSASPSTNTVGKSVTLTWTATAGSTCSASSSSSRSPWSGNVAPTGSAAVTETAAGTDTYTLQCTAPGTSTVTQTASVVWTSPPVTVTSSASPTKSGGGRLDPLYLCALLGILALRQIVTPRRAGSHLRRKSHR